MSPSRATQVFTFDPRSKKWDAGSGAREVFESDFRASEIARRIAKDEGETDGVDDVENMVCLESRHTLQ